MLAVVLAILAKLVIILKLGSFHPRYHTFAFHLLFSFILMLIIIIFQRLNYTLLELHLIITHLVNTFYCCPPGCFIVPHKWEIVVRKNLTIFEGCYFAGFYILIWWSFPKIEAKNFNSGSCFFKLAKLGMISPATHFGNCVHIGRSQTIAAIICNFLSGKRFVKLRGVF